MTTKTKKKTKDAPASRETPVGFFTTAALRRALEAEARALNRSRSRHLHAILEDRYPRAAAAAEN